MVVSSSVARTSNRDPGEDGIGGSSSSEGEVGWGLEGMEETSISVNVNSGSVFHFDQAECVHSTYYLNKSVICLLFASVVFQSKQTTNNYRKDFDLTQGSCTVT